jgi:hypothetical protein
MVKSLLSENKFFILSMIYFLVFIISVVSFYIAFNFMTLGAIEESSPYLIIAILLIIISEKDKSKFVQKYNKILFYVPLAFIIIALLPVVFFVLLSILEFQHP